LGVREHTTVLPLQDPVMSRLVPFPHLFMAISVALVTALAVFVLIVPWVAGGEESTCTGADTRAGRPVGRCGDGAAVGEQDLVGIR
jgi:hypothetical protein